MALSEIMKALGMGPNEQKATDPLFAQDEAQLHKINDQLGAIRDAYEGINELRTKGRDLTKDETATYKQMTSFVKEQADKLRKTMGGPQFKGMSDYSVVQKSQEDMAAELNQRHQRDAEAMQPLHAKRDLLAEAADPANKIDLAGLQKTQRALGMPESQKLSLKAQGDVRSAAAKALPALREEISLKGKALDLSKHELAVAEENLKVTKSTSAEIAKEAKEASGGGGGGGGGRRGGYNRKTDFGLMVAGDLGIPGVSHAAKIARYGGFGAEAASGLLGEEAAGGLAGSVLGGVGAVGGMALGAGVLAGGYMMGKGYQAFNQAEQIAPMQRTLFGQAGQGRARDEIRGAVSGRSAKYGYDAMEDMQEQMQLNRQLGGRGGRDAFNDVTKTSYQFGLTRGETGAQAGALFAAGGAKPSESGSALKKILMEGVKGGIDRARITQFSQQVIGIQEDILQTTGENNAQSIARSLGAFMKASGRGEQFMHGPEMGALRGIDTGLKSAGRGGLSGQGALTLMRAMGGPEERQGQLGHGYVEMLGTMEQGLFGGKGKGAKGDAVGRTKAVLGEYFKESGGEGLLGKKRNATEEKQFGKSEDIVRMRMQQELGVGVNQSKALISLMDKMKSGGGGEKEFADKLAEIEEENKDPMQKLMEVQKEANNQITKLATSEVGLKTAIDLETASLYLTKAAVNALTAILEKMEPVLEDAVKGIGVIADYFGGGDKGSDADVMPQSDIDKFTTEGAGAPGDETPFQYGMRGVTLSNENLPEHKGPEESKTAAMAPGLTPEMRSSFFPGSTPPQGVSTTPTMPGTAPVSGPTIPESIKADLAVPPDITSILKDIAEGLKRTSIQRRHGSVNGGVR